jgi:acid phosphatase family membrane protein YuiD
LNEGFGSPLFAITAVLSFIVMYDAMGVRYETGKQAEIINVLMKGHKTFKEKTILLKEKVGHLPIEVFGGCLLGIVIALIFYYFI